MRGLLLKDLLVLRKTLRFYILFLVFYFILALLGAFDAAFVTTFAQVMLMMLPMSACAMDEQAKWDCYAMALPLGSRGVVAGRYLFVLVLWLLALAFGVGISFASSLLGQGMLLDGVAAALAASGAGMVIVGILLPLCYKLGVERARPFLFAVVGVPFVAAFLLERAGVFSGLDLSVLNELSPAAEAGLIALFPLVGLAVLGVSYLVSCRVMAQKEL